MADPKALPLGLMTTTVVDFGEATCAFETMGQLTSVGELALVGVGEGIAEPYFTHTEDAGESAPTGFEALEADGILVNMPAGVTMWAHVRANVDGVDSGTGAEEGEDTFDFVVLVNGLIVDRSEEGATDAADLASPAEFTYDGLVALEEGDVLQFAYFNAADADEEYTVVTEAAEAQVIISPRT